MTELSNLYWVLIIAAVILQVLLIVKFWGMCNDIRALRNHFTPAQQEEESDQPQLWRLIREKWYLFALLVVFILSLLFG